MVCLRITVPRQALALPQECRGGKLRAKVWRCIASIRADLCSGGGAAAAAGGGGGGHGVGILHRCGQQD
jgi:hypothetical protein